MFNCSKQDVSLLPSLLLLKNINIDRRIPSISYNYNTVRYYNYFDKDIKFVPVINGSEPFRISLQTPLPDGFVMDSKTGVISGSPTSTKLIKEQTYKISISNSYGSAFSEIKFQIGQPDYYNESRLDLCYNNTVEIPCGSDPNFPRQDAEFLKSDKANDFHKNYTLEDFPNDFIFVDKNRAISWSCAIGQKGKDCADSSEVPLLSGNFSSTYEEAVNSCNALNSKNLVKGYAGKKNWRLPEIYELQTLLQYNKSPALNNEFISTSLPASTCDKFWSNTSVNSNPSLAWVLDSIATASSIAGSGVSRTVNKTNDISKSCYYCISGQTFFKPNYTDNADGTILDNRTNLVWQKCPSGFNNDQSCSGSAIGLNWSNALKYCASLTLANKSWRLPGVNELLSIVDYTKNVPSIDPIFPITTFPTTNPLLFFFTSTTQISGTSKARAYLTSFQNLGGIFGGTNQTTILIKSNSLRSVRCVSDK